MTRFLSLLAVFTSILLPGLDAQASAKRVLMIINEGFMAHPETGLVRVESQAFQSTLIQEVMRDYPHIPIEGVKTDTDKVTRARAVAAKYEAHKVHHHISLKGSEFELELASFPKGHDDMIDALGLAMDLGGDGFYFGKIKR